MKEQKPAHKQEVLLRREGIVELAIYNATAMCFETAQERSYPVTSNLLWSPLLSPHPETI